MAVELADLIDSLRREISPLSGTNPYSTVTDATLEGMLADAFWEGRLNGMFDGYTLDLDAGTIVPLTDGTDDMDRVDQQAIVLWAGYRTVLNDMRNVQSVFRAKAGPVEYEVQQSASVLAEVLKAIKERIDRLIFMMSESDASSALVFDSVIASTFSIDYGESWWVL